MYELKYGKTKFSVGLPESQIGEVVEANRVDLPRRTVREHIEHALDNPIGAGPLGEAVGPGDTVAILISDVTRKWQRQAEVLPVLVERLNALGIPDGDIRILSANGTHRAQTEEEHRTLLGPLFGRFRLIDHDCDDRDHLTNMGTTTRGTPVWLNSYAMACDKLILTGGVVYHCLAGFGGGRKSVVPGIAGRETINTNHNNGLSAAFGGGSNPDARSGNMTDTNPFHADLEEAAAMAKPAYLLNVVMDSATGGVAAAFAGDWRKAHRAAAELVEKLDGVYVQSRRPLVLASAGGYPKDINLYQTVKTLCNALLMATPGGTLILLSECAEGFGDPDCEKQIAGYATMEERERALRADFSIGGFVGFLFAESAERYDLILVTSLPRERFGSVRLRVAATLDEALDIAGEINGGLEGLEAALMPHGANTLPKYR